MMTYADVNGARGAWDLPVLGDCREYGATVAKCRIRGYVADARRYRATVVSIAARCDCGAREAVWGAFVDGYRGYLAGIRAGESR